ncbi:MAG TPA: helix-hairpin-helix domain-containing protein, partial [Methylomirabilota bacterium]|nr:helix-hairpin-helix domain-containing protein [Methylomirabilota bacterium]
MKNVELARLFHEMARLLEARNESVFRVRAYQRGAQTLEALGEDVAAVAARGELQRLPGIGRDLAARIDEYLATGALAGLAALRAEVPPTFLGLLEVRGLGPRTARALYEQLGVDSVEALEAACRSRRVIGVAGVRDKTCENLLAAIARWKAGRQRTPVAAARAVAHQVAAALRAQGGVERLEVAGSLRRMLETVKDVDLLVTSTEPARVIRTLVSLPSVAEVLGHGDTKATVR